MRTPARSRGLAPRLWDYFYVSLTNATAFSPTDAMPLTRPAKARMAPNPRPQPSPSCSSPRAQSTFSS